MKNNVVIKGNKHGIVLILDNELPFDELKQEIISKFKESADFFGNAQMALQIDGRKLLPSEEKELLDIISAYTSLSIICIVDSDNERDEKFQSSIESRLKAISSQNGQFYKGTLRSGQELESPTSIVILGNVNSGAKITSTGNVIVLGALKGTVYAGITGNQNSFVVALEMDPMQIRIGDVIARSSDTKKKNVEKEAKIAYVDNGSICIDTLNNDVIKYIN